MGKGVSAEARGRLDAADLTTLLEGCCEDLWRVATLAPNDLLGSRKKKIVSRLVEDLAAEVPEHYQKYFARDDFRASDLTNTDAAMLLGQCLTVVRIHSKRRAPENVSA
jgi:hypothetical protein